MYSSVTSIVKESNTNLNKYLRLKDTENKAEISANHTNLSLNKLNPYFVTGGEGSAYPPRMVKDHS
jgi:hypothetical protein